MFNRLASLFSSHVKTPFDGNVVVSIEKEEGKRIFCFLTISDFKLFFNEIPASRRCFYECIPPNHPVKLYIDFEYPIDINPTTDENAAIKTVLVLMQTITDGSILPSFRDKESLIDRILQDVLVLEA